MQIFDDPRRLRLSGMAAAGADVQPQLRLLMLAEALAAPPTHRALDLSAETAVRVPPPARPCGVGRAGCT